jgi:16S rRNA (cytosine967-C5)-methyltransferase
MAEQRAILADASRHVKPGGRLAYITCSVFDEENAAQVDAFLGAHPAFRPVDHAALWSEVFPAQPDVARLDAAAGIRLSPAMTGTDGFFFAALQRVT